MAAIGVQVKAVVMPPPHRADRIRLLQDRDSHVRLFQARRARQPGRPGTDDDRLLVAFTVLSNRAHAPAPSVGGQGYVKSAPMGSVFGKRERFGMCHRQGRYPDNLVGAPLMRAAFHADSGSLTDTTLKPRSMPTGASRSEEHTSELQSRENLVCRLLLAKKKKSRNLTAPSETRCTIPGRRKTSCLC